MRKALLTLMLVGLFSVASAQKMIFVPGGFITGGAFQRMSPTEQQRYAAGAWDGLVSAPLVANADLPSANKLGECGQAMNMDDGQLRAIAIKYVDAHPERWSYPMANLLLYALIDACASLG